MLAQGCGRRRCRCSLEGTVLRGTASPLSLQPRQKQRSRLCSAVLGARGLAQPVCRIEGLSLRFRARFSQLQHLPPAHATTTSGRAGLDSSALWSLKKHLLLLPFLL